MNLVLFFEGTGQGVHGKVTNVTRLFDLCEESDSQHRHIESGPGTHFGAYLFGKAMGVDAKPILRRARRWFQENYDSLADHGLGTKVYLFGFSRGALIAREFALWLDLIGIDVEFLGLWDTVDSTPGVEVSEECPDNVHWARHAVARDEFRKHFNYEPLKGPQVEEMLFPGCHSDVGGLYDDNHAIADVALEWIASAAAESGLRLNTSNPELPTSNSKLPEFVVHNSLNLISNLFGLLGRVPRVFGTMKKHQLCEIVKG